MAYKCFMIPVRHSEDAETELNAFLRSHRVLSVERRWVDQGSDSFWSFCVDYLEGKQPELANLSRRGKDYKEILSPGEFAVFAQLRELRKLTAQEEGVPVYAIFTNEQLAQMVQTKVRSKNDLRHIAGIGEGRIEKYGDRFVAAIIKLVNADHEASREPVPDDSGSK